MDEEECLAITKQQSDALQRLLENLRGEWDDTASQELHRLYLDPHHTHDEFMLGAFEAQLAFLHQSKDWLNVADEHILETRLAHEEMEKLLDYAGLQMDSAEVQRRQSVEYEQDARSHLSGIQEFIGHANRAGR